MKKIDPLIIKIMDVRQEAMGMKRFRTFHALTDALRVAGYELADILTGDQKIGDIEKRKP